MQKIHIRKYLILGAAILLLAAGCGPQGPTRPSQDVDTQRSQTQTEVTPQPASQTTKPAVRDKGSYQTPLQDELPAQTAEHVLYRGQDGKNALDLLKAGHKVEVKTYSGIGEFVDGIDGLKSDAQHFWSFYVNGKQATVGAGSYTTKAAELIEWKFEKIK